MSEGNALEFTINAVQSLGGEIIAHDEEKRQVVARLTDHPMAAVALGDLVGLDKAEAVRRIERQLKFPNQADTRWTPYLNHALLIQKYKFMPIMDVRVDFITPSGKYVRLQDLSTNRHFWSPVEDYEILEDLGVSIIKHPTKPVLQR